MGIQGFTASSSGLPGKQYISQTYLTTQYRSWTQAGGPGYYTLVSNGENAGYAYFNSSGATVGAPLNGVADVTGGSGFTSITIVGKVGDVVSLYKVTGIKSTSGLSATMNTTTYNSSQSNITLSTNKTGFIDAFLVGGGGGGGGQHYGSGGGGGGVVLLQSWPLDPIASFNVTIGSHGTVDSNSNGGDTKFGGAVAKGGGFGGRNHNSSGGDGGCGGGAGSHGTAAATPGKSIQGTGTAGLEIPAIFPSAFGNTAALTGFGNSGGVQSANSNHNGGGGGGAGGAGSTHNGGPGYLLSWNNTYYAAGGSGVRHSSDGTFSNGTGWGNAGSGSYSNSQNHGATAGTAGAVIVRSFNLS
jgi:hypothetical protein